MRWARVVGQTRRRRRARFRGRGRGGELPRPTSLGSRFRLKWGPDAAAESRGRLQHG